MKNHIFCLFLLMMLSMFVASADTKHVVQRGESVESIAMKYGISKEKLLEANKDAKKLFYIGQTLTIPHNANSTANSRKTNNKAVNSVLSVELALEADAKRYFDNREWKKAVKTYSKLIKKYPKAVYYYNRGLAHFNNKKNRQAANDFRKALSMDDCTSSMKTNGSSLLAEAEKRHKQWQDRQMNLIGSIILGTAAAGLSTWAAVESAKIEPAYGASSYGSSRLSSGMGVSTVSSNYNTTFNQIMDKTVQEFQMQEQTEYQQARSAWLQMTGKDLSIEEWRIQKGQAIQDMQSQGSGASSTSSSDDYWSESNRQERNKDNLNRTVGKDCLSCKGYGTCSACGGSKVVTRNGVTYKCTVCDDDGKCPVCKGTGLTSWNRN